MTFDFLNLLSRERERERERERRPGALLGVLFAAALIFVILNAWAALLPFAYAVDPVTVTATVAQTITCDSDLAGSSTAFGTLPTGSVTTASPNASTTLSCNVGAGCTLSVLDVGNTTNGGLATSTPAYLIPSPNAAFDPFAALVAGTEGYGIVATTTAGGSGGTLAIYSRYDKDSGGNTVGKLQVTAFGLASSSQAISNRQLIVTHKAAISGVTEAAKYEDTITYSCAAN